MFSVIGLLFILLFTIRGIYLVVFTVINCSGDISALLSGSSIARAGHLAAILQALMHSPGSGFNAVLMILCNLMILHAVLGVFYAIKTKYNFKNMCKEKAFFYLQIISALAAGFTINFLIKSFSFHKTVANIYMNKHLGVGLIVSAFIAIIAAFHIRNGFYNACITLGISVSKGTKTIANIFSCIAAAFSILQIILLMI